MPAPARRSTSRLRRSVSRPRRHPPAGGYARGERTRRRIIETAIDMFGRLGYERTSTRAIARHAAVSLPALTYYFGGKEGLHRACAEYMVDDMRERLEPAASRVAESLRREPLSRAELLQLLRSVLDPFIEGMAVERPESWVAFFVRAQNEGGAAWAVFFERVVSRITALAAQIVARLLHKAPDDPEALIRALCIVGQTALVRRARPILLRALGWHDFSGKRLELLKQALWRQIAEGLAGD